jgi:hypothetical protein
MICRLVKRAFFIRSPFQTAQPFGTDAEETSTDSLQHTHTPQNVQIICGWWADLLHLFENLPGLILMSFPNL